MGIKGRLTVPALAACLLAAGSPSALAQPTRGQFEHVTALASAVTGQIDGRVADDAGHPLDGVVVSALGSTSAFAVSDTSGQFVLRQLPPGPYLLRAHRQGYLTDRGTIVEVRPAVRTPSSFTMRREGGASDSPRITEAGLGLTSVEAQPASADNDGEPSESTLAWKLRRLKRSVLRDADGMNAFAGDDDSSLAAPFELLGRAVESSARAAGAFLSDIPLDGRVDLLTTGAFDHPADLLDRTRNVAYFSVGSNVGGHGDWKVRAAMNQGDLDSWIVAGSFAARSDTSHRYRTGMSYSLQRYQGGNSAALAAVSDAARNVGSVFAFDEWSVSRRLTIDYGAAYAHYDYLVEPSLLSPRISATFAPTAAWRIRGLASRQLSAPGAQEFLPPTRASWLPPQRTFSPLSRSGFRTQGLEHYEFGIERVLRAATVGVRGFRQRVDDQMITLFGLRSPDRPAENLGHYYVASGGDADIRGIGVSITRAWAENVRGSVEYSVASAQWTDGPPAADLARLRRVLPGVLHGTERERVHDVMTSLETDVPQTATRVVLFYRLNNAFIKAEAGEETRGLDGRFELQVNQALPFMNFMGSQWEMLVAVRNMFHEATPDASTYDEILVVRPPKRIVGGLTVRF